jgi:hypothetical protein
VTLSTKRVSHAPITRQGRRLAGASDLKSAADLGGRQVENEDLLLIIWKDNGQRDNWSGTMKTLGCKFTGMSTFDYVDGDRWTITGANGGGQPSQTLAKKISDAIGGKPEHIVCGGR